MDNPLFSRKSIVVYDDKLNEEIKLTYENISHYFRYVYYLCPLDTINIEQIMMQKIEPTLFNECINKMVLYRSNVSIVKNVSHYNNIVHCDVKYVLQANKFNYMIDNHILIIPVFNIAFLSLQHYIDNMNGSTSFDKLYDTIILNNYFGEKRDITINKTKTNKMIESLDEAYYWTYPYNCMINLTKSFNERQFVFNQTLNKNSNMELVKLYQTLKDTSIHKEYIENIFSEKHYVDPSIVIKKYGAKLYCKIWSCEYTMNDINNLFNFLNDYQRYVLFSKLIVSKKHCHLVVANQYILKLMKPVTHQYIELYRYLFGYAWLRFYFEEGLNRFNVKTDDMYIFDINTASELPVFYYDHQTPTMNPYCPILIDLNILDVHNNVFGVRANINYKQNRICNLFEFKTRMNIFISGDQNIDLFDTIDMNQMKMAVTGSIMTACAQYCHPLLELFNFDTSDKKMNELYNRYFDEYYYEADIDIMIKSSSSIDFFDKTMAIYEKLMLNICKYFDAEPTNIKYNIIRNSYLFVSPAFIRNNICTDSLPYEYISENLDNELIKQLFVPFAIQLHKKYTEELLAEYTDDMKATMIEIYKDIFNYDSSTLNIKINTAKNNPEFKQSNPNCYKYHERYTPKNHYVNNVSQSHGVISDIGFSDNFKVKISAPQLNHDFELFPIKKDDFMTSVANFHMPCVRAYYNGNVYMTPSFITAHMTYMNIDYKYFAGSKDPIEIINKYRMRGFGTWLNKEEIKTYKKYCALVPFWRELYSIDIANKNTYKNCVGIIEKDHKLFHPRLYCGEHLTNNKIRPIPLDEPYNINIKTTYMDESSYNSHRFKASKIQQKIRYATINASGSINPLILDIICVVNNLFPCSEKIISTPIQTEPYHHPTVVLSEIQPFSDISSSEDENILDEID
jgi:hypothetical protein